MYRRGVCFVLADVLNLVFGVVRGVGLTAADFRQLIDLGNRIKRAVMDSMVVEHPFEQDLGFLYGTIFVGPAHEAGHHGRNVCIFADGRGRSLPDWNRRQRADRSAIH